MKRPPKDDLLLAAEWARAYEEGCDDAERLEGVARWLEWHAGLCDQADFVREAKKVGATHSQACAAWKKLLRSSSGGGR